MKAVVVLMMMAGTGMGQANPKTSAVNYANPHEVGVRILPIFSDDPRHAYFTLSTSWIPGSDKKGYFRYIIEAGTFGIAPKDGSNPPKQGWSLGEYIKREHGCSYTLALYDSGGFILQNVDPIFQILVGSDNKPTSMRANNMREMDLHTYQEFLKAKTDSSWDITWTC